STERGAMISPRVDTSSAAGGGATTSACTDSVGAGKDSPKAMAARIGRNLMLANTSSTSRQARKVYNQRRGVTGTGIQGGWWGPFRRAGGLSGAGDGANVAPAPIIDRAAGRDNRGQGLDGTGHRPLK